MVMIEAMACGCPVISFERGAAPEIVVNGENGFLVHDVAEMVQRMEHIDEIDRDSLRPYVEEYFSARVMAENYVQLYEQVIDMQKGRTTNRGAAAKKTSSRV